MTNVLFSITFVFAFLGPFSTLYRVFIFIYFVQKRSYFLRMFVFIVFFLSVYYFPFMNNSVSVQSSVLITEETILKLVVEVPSTNIVEKIENEYVVGDTVYSFSECKIYMGKDKNVYLQAGFPHMIFSGKVQLRENGSGYTITAYMKLLYSENSGYKILNNCRSDSCKKVGTLVKLGQYIAHGEEGYLNPPKTEPVEPE